MASLKILIVDDDVDFADGLVELFELEGHAPAMVHTGGEGVAAAQAGGYDVALIDIGLPDMNGAECLRAIKAALPGLVCFLLTGYSAEDVARHGVGADLADILTKPVDPEELNQRLAAI